MATGESEQEDRSPVDGDVSRALREFGAARVTDAWEDARRHRVDNPRIALTAAKELLESLCKHILDLSDIPYEDHAELPELYRLTARSMDLAPSQQSEDTFRRIFGGCVSVVEGIGSIRNQFGSAHGKGHDAPTALPRHAALGVDLAGVMAVYLVKTWNERQLTLRDIIEAFLKNPPPGKTAHGTGRRTSLDNFLRAPIANLPAPRITKDHFIEWAMERLSQVVGATVLQDIAMLSKPLEHARDVLGIEAPLIAQRQARTYLREQGLASQSKRRERRLDPNEYVRIMEYFAKRYEDPRTKIRMTVMVDMALETACTAAEICSLLWEDVDHVRRICPVRGTERVLKLSSKAWEIIQDQEPTGDPRIFPWKHKSTSASFTRATRRLEIKDLRYHDLHYEAMARMFEGGYHIHEVERMVEINDPVWLRHLFNKYYRPR